MKTINKKDDYNLFNKYFNNLENVNEKEFNYFQKHLQKLFKKLIYKQIEFLNKTTKKILVGKNKKHFLNDFEVEELIEKCIHLIFISKGEYNNKYAPTTFIYRKTRNFILTEIRKISNIENTHGNELYAKITNCNNGDILIDNNENDKKYKEGLSLLIKILENSNLMKHYGEQLNKWLKQSASGRKFQFFKTKVIKTENFERYREFFETEYL